MRVNFFVFLAVYRTAIIANMFVVCLLYINTHQSPDEEKNINIIHLRSAPTTLRRPNSNERRKKLEWLRPKEEKKVREKCRICARWSTCSTNKTKKEGENHSIIASLDHEWLLNPQGAQWWSNRSNSKRICVRWKLHVHHFIAIFLQFFGEIEGKIFKTRTSPNLRR